MDDKDRALLALRQDIEDVARKLDQLKFRVMAAAYEAAEVHGVGSPEHLRLRYALTGEGEGAASESAQMAVMRRYLETGEAEGTR